MIEYSDTTAVRGYDWFGGFMIARGRAKFFSQW
jgi:hypothetical protein